MYESRTCYLPMITDVSRELLRLYTHYRNGHLPVSGGISDQPAAFLEAVELIEDHHGRRRPVHDKR